MPKTVFAEDVTQRLMPGSKLRKYTFEYAVQALLDESFK